MQKSLIIVDNFYANPDDIRNFALSVDYVEDNRWYKGLRSTKNYQFEGIKEIFEQLIGEKIVSFPNEGSNNGCFQIVDSNQPQVYHCDLQKWAAIIYLTPNAPHESGTRLHRSRLTGLCQMATDQDAIETFKYGNYDSTRFDTIDSVGNVYNRLVIMAAQNIHSAGPYFGNSKDSGRLTHLFFFD